MSFYFIDTEDENYHWRQMHRTKPNMFYGLVFEPEGSPVSLRIRRDASLNLGKYEGKHLKLKAISVQVRLGGH